MAATLTTINDMLKEDYLGPIREILNNKILLLSQIEQTSEYTSGKRAYIPLHTGRNEGLGARGENETLPTAGNQQYDNAVYNMTYLYGRMQVTGPAAAAARDEAGAFARAFESEIQGLIKDAKRDMNRQCFQGKNGILTAVDAANPDATLTTQVDSVQFLRKGMKVDFVDPATLAVRASGEDTDITAVSRANKTFTAASTIGGDVADNDGITRAGAAGKEIYGLVDLISASNAAMPSAGGLDDVGGIDRTANDFWQANDIDHGDNAFNQDLFQQAIDASDIEGDGSLDMFLTTHNIYNSYAKTLLPDRRYNVNSGGVGALDGGWESLDYNGIPVVRDRDCQAGVIYGISRETLMLLIMSDWDWLDKDGSVLSRVSNTDAYEATLFKYCELAIDDPRDNVVIRNVKAI